MSAFDIISAGCYLGAPSFAAKVFFFVLVSFFPG
jgi:hypothetical protein